jgi:oligopeptide/dipeptide ABC transporter ATP-binding protein
MRLQEIPGMVPTLAGERVGCSFAPRCPKSTDICRKSDPQLEDYGNGHLTACFNCRSA